jgi:nicotinamide-nucleotide adenylyltransferase
MTADDETVTDAKDNDANGEEREAVAHVHGRFQPFHREHLEYAAWAATDADALVVGITNADASHVAEEDADPERHEPANNPFAYHERHRMIRAAVDAAGFDLPVRIMPFPINRPALWDAYAPRDAVHFVNVLEEWHEVKARRIRDHGREVRTKAGTRTVSGTEIRDRMAAGDPWREEVPAGVASVIEAVEGVERVRRHRRGTEE